MADALHQRLLAAVVAGIESLALPGIGEVKVRKIPFRAKLTLPAVMVTSFQKAETYEGGTLGRDDVAYPVYVVFVTADPQDDTTGARVLLWRQRVSRLFRNQPLSAAPEVVTCRVEPDPVFDWDPEVADFQFSAMTLRFVCREPRGLAAAGP